MNPPLKGILLEVHVELASPDPENLKTPLVFLAPPRTGDLVETAQHRYLVTAVIHRVGHTPDEATAITLLLAWQAARE